MKHHMHMSARELLETFGKGKKGHRVVSSDMVRWLLSEPPRHLLDVAKILKEPIDIKPITQDIAPPNPVRPPQAIMVSPSMFEKMKAVTERPSTFNFEL